MAQKEPKYRRGFLASRVPLTIELEFKAAAKAQDTSPSALIRQFVEGYLMGYRMVEMEAEHERVPA